MLSIFGKGKDKKDSKKDSKAKFPNMGQGSEQTGYAGYGGGSTSTSTSKKKTTRSQQKIQRRGDIADLQKLLISMISDTRNHKRLPDVVKKVIAFMTLGIDVSELFTEMSMLSYTTDLITKKLIFLYLTTYSENNPDLAIMAINSFVKDLNNKDYKIRGLALRSLCSLHFEGVMEFTIPHVITKLNDENHYVKKTAVNACIKLYYIDPSFIEENNIINILYDMIKDPHHTVVISAINALHEIMQEEGGMAVNENIIIYLINRIKDFNEFGQVIILELIYKHNLTSEDEMYGIMNNIAELLKGSSCSVILGTIKIFLKYIEYQSEIVDEAMKRIKGPLLTLLSNGSKELRFTVVCHIQNLINRGAAPYFIENYKSFYCLADDPHYIQQIKFSILVKLASEDNLGDILSELAEYCNDIDEFLSKTAVETLGKLGIRFPKRNSSIIKQLMSFIKLKRTSLMDSIAKSLAMTLSKNSSKVAELSSELEELLDNVKEERGKISVVWMLGEFGNQIDSAPYLLEDIIKECYENSEEDDKEETTSTRKVSSKMKLNLLTASVKLYMRKPAEMYPGLCILFRKIVDNPDEDVDVLDRAGYYYTMLKNNMEALRTSFEEMRYSEIGEADQAIKAAKLEFNTLAVIYNKPPETFIKKFDKLRNQRKKESSGDQTDTKTPKETEDLLDIDSTPNTAEVTEEEALEEESNPIAELVNCLDNEFELDSEVFQEKWAEIEEGVEKKIEIKSAKDSKVLEKNLKLGHLYSIATMDEEDEIRFYLYAKYMAQILVMVELKVFNGEGRAEIMAKSSKGGFSAKVVELIEGIIQRS